jgi:hypothetical protein
VKSNQFEEKKKYIGQEIDKLTRRRNLLGLFSGQQKKEIDEKVLSLRTELEQFRKSLRLDEAKSRLNSLENS